MHRVRCDVQTRLGRRPVLPQYEVRPGLAGVVFGSQGPKFDSHRFASIETTPDDSQAFDFAFIAIISSLPTKR
jgi:hypothetical protein